MKNDRNTVRTWKLLWLVIALCGGPSALCQNEIAWQLVSTPSRPLDTVESPLIAESFALVGVGAGVGVYELESGAHVRDIFLPPPNAVERRTFAAADSRLLITDSIWAPNDIRGHSRAFVFDIKSGERVSQLELPTPTLRLGMGASVAMDDQIALISSLSCLDTCFDEERFMVRGVVDGFEVESGKHLFEIVSPDNSVFAQGLAIGDGLIAISSRSRALDRPGRVSLYDASDGSFVASLSPATSSGALGHNFGYDLDIDNRQLVVGDNPDLLGHGMLGDGKGRVYVFDLASRALIKSLEPSDVNLEGTPRFGTSVSIHDGRVIVGAPSSGLKLETSPPQITSELESGACAASFTTGAPCFTPLRPISISGEPTGRAQLVDVQTGGWVRRTGWIGGDAVSINNDFALVRSVANDRSSVYAISLEGLLAPAESTLSLQPIGDIDDDGMIQFSDFLILSSNYGLQVSGIHEGDLDHDGTVGFGDFLILSDHFGMVGNVVPVPETVGGVATWILLVAAWATSHFPGALPQAKSTMRPSVEACHDPTLDGK